MYLQLGWLCSTHPGAKEGHIYLEGFHPGFRDRLWRLYFFHLRLFPPLSGRRIRRAFFGRVRQVNVGRFWFTRRKLFAEMIAQIVRISQA